MGRMGLQSMRVDHSGEAPLMLTHQSLCRQARLTEKLRMVNCILKVVDDGEAFFPHTNIT